MFKKDGPSFWELTKQALSSTNDGYDLLAEKFDHTPFRASDEILDIVGAFIDDNKIPCTHALDACTGTGAALSMLRQRSEHAVGVDLSHGMLLKGQSLHASQSGAPYCYVRGDGRELPFKDAFDLVVSFGAFGHIEDDDEARFIRSIHATLKVGGRFMFVTSYPPVTFSTANFAARSFNGVMRLRNAVLSPPFIMYYLTFMLPKIRNTLEGNGFTVIEHRPFGGSLKRLVLVEAEKRGAR